MAQAVSTGTFFEAKWLVDPTVGQGTHITPQDAINAASSGDTVFVRPGTYTAPTLKAGVNVAAYDCDSSQNATGHVIFSGATTMTTAGTVSISGIQLQTNSTALLAVTGSAASIVNLSNCYLNCTNNTGITYSSSSGSSAINIFNCNGNLGTTGIGYFTSTAAGVLRFTGGVYENTGGSSTTSTTSVSQVIIEKLRFNAALETTGTGFFSINYSGISPDAAGLNLTALTTAGTGVSTTTDSSYRSGSASAISIGSGTTLRCSGVTDAYSTNTNAITGLGTFSGITTYSNSSSLNNVTTKNQINMSVGGISFDYGTNTLSNYAQGTFTPTIVGAVAGTTTYSSQAGFYTRIGNRVFVEATIVISSATGTGNAILGGLPFTINNTTNNTPMGACKFNGSGWTWPVGTTSACIQGTLNSITALIKTSGSAVAAGDMQMTNAALTISYSLCYFV